LNPVARAQTLQENLMDMTGLCKGDELFKWVEKLIYRKTGIRYCTFEELHQFAIQQPEKYKDLYIYAICLQNNQLPEIVEFSHEHNEWKYVPISSAIRASTSIPGLFVPHVIHHKFSRDGKLRLSPDSGRFIDGGLIYNFPLNTFDQNKYQNTKRDDWGATVNRESLGFTLVASQEISLNVDQVTDLAKVIMYTFYHAEDILLQTRPYEKGRIISISVDDTIPINKFDLTDEQKQKLIEAGAKAISQFLDS